jgi:hypothetical protein
MRGRTSVSLEKYPAAVGKGFSFRETDMHNSYFRIGGSRRPSFLTSCGSLAAEIGQVRATGMAIGRKAERARQYWQRMSTASRLSFLSSRPRLINVEQAGGALSNRQAGVYRGKYRRILALGDTESPPPDKQQRKPGQRGRIKRSKSRSLLERLRNYEADVLRFMIDPGVPFTNNQGENDIRMTKVQQKISGCFRSTEGAENFCLIRGYLSSCRKHQCTASDALTNLFQDGLPGFFQKGW